MTATLVGPSRAPGCGQTAPGAALRSGTSCRGAAGRAARGRGQATAGSRDRSVLTAPARPRHGSSDARHRALTPAHSSGQVCSNPVSCTHKATAFLHETETNQQEQGELCCASASPIASPPGSSPYPALSRSWLWCRPWHTSGVTAHQAIVSETTFTLMKFSLACAWSLFFLLFLRKVTEPERSPSKKGAAL